MGTDPGAVHRGIEGRSNRRHGCGPAGERDEGGAAVYGAVALPLSRPRGGPKGTPDRGRLLTPGTSPIRRPGGAAAVRPVGHSPRRCQTFPGRTVRPAIPSALVAG